MAFNSFLYHIVIIIIVSLVNNTIIVLNRSKEVCLYKELFSDDSVKISYSITGSSENAVTCTFYGPNGDILFEKSNHNSGDFQHKTVVPEGSLGTYNLCFKQNYGKNFISFEFSSTQEGGDIIKIAKEQTITGLSNNLTTISNYLEEIENKIKKYIFRKRAHNSSKLVYNRSNSGFNRIH